MLDQARASARRAHAVADRASDEVFRISSEAVLGHVELLAGDLHAAIEILRPLPERQLRAGHRGPTCDPWVDTIEVLIALGQLDEAQEHLDRYRELPCVAHTRSRAGAARAEGLLHAARRRQGRRAAGTAGRDRCRRPARLSPGAWAHAARARRRPAPGAADAARPATPSTSPSRCSSGSTRGRGRTRRATTRARQRAPRCVGRVDRRGAARRVAGSGRAPQQGDRRRTFRQRRHRGAAPHERLPQAGSAVPRRGSPDDSPESGTMPPNDGVVSDSRTRRPVLSVSGATKSVPDRPQ